MQLNDNFTLGDGGAQICTKKTPQLVVGYRKWCWGNGFAVLAVANPLNSDSCSLRSQTNYSSIEPLLK